MSQIYKKQIDPSVQGGSDVSVVLSPNEYYQKAFDFGDDWTEIKMGLFYSYTSSLSDANTSLGVGGKIDSGGTTADTFTYFGAVKDTPEKYIPTDTGAGTFMGMRLVSSSDALGRFLASGADYLDLKISNGETILGSYTSISNAQAVPIPFDTSGDTTLFAGYTAIKLSVLDKGLVTQRVEVSTYRPDSSILTPQNSITDVSLPNLKNLINGTDFVTTAQIREFNDGVSALPLPDAFFFYNAFQDARPRLHAVAVKKIS